MQSCRKAALPKKFKAGADNFARVRRHKGASPIVVAKEMMTTPDAHNMEADFASGQR
jgi:hypothetical protein